MSEGKIMPCFFVRPRRLVWLVPYTLTGAIFGLCGHILAIAFYVTLFQSDRPLAAAQWSIDTALTLVDNPFIAMWIYFALLFLSPIAVCGVAAIISGSVIVLPLAHFLKWSHFQRRIWFLLWLSPTAVLWSFAILASRSISLWSDIGRVRWGMLGAVLSFVATIVALCIRDTSTPKPHPTQ
jgi:hypothetical protein